MTIIEQNTMYAIQHMARSLDSISANLFEIKNMIASVTKDRSTEDGRARMKEAAERLSETVRNIRVNG